MFYIVNCDISYYMVYELYVVIILLVFCEVEKMDLNIQFLKVMMIDEFVVFDWVIVCILVEVKEKYIVLKSVLYFFEIFDKWVNKGIGVKLLVEVLGIKLEEVMVIGDQENDIVMIEYVGMGVVMDNVILLVKEVVNFVIKLNFEDGVVWVIEKFVLNFDYLFGYFFV